MIKKTEYKNKPNIIASIDPGTELERIGDHFHYSWMFSENETKITEKDSGSKLITLRNGMFHQDFVHTNIPRLYHGSFLVPDEAINKLHLPVLTKAHKAKLTKGSKWRVTNEVNIAIDNRRLCVGKDSVYELTSSRASNPTTSNDRIKMLSYTVTGPQCINRIMYSSPFTTNRRFFLPIHLMLNNMEMVEEGEPKRYFKISLDGDTSESKKYSTLHRALHAVLYFKKEPKQTFSKPIIDNPGQKMTDAVASATNIEIVEYDYLTDAEVKSTKFDHLYIEWKMKNT